MPFSQISASNDDGHTLGPLSSDGGWGSKHARVPLVQYPPASPLPPHLTRDPFSDSPPPPLRRVGAFVRIRPNSRRRTTNNSCSYDHGCSYAQAPQIRGSIPLCESDRQAAGVRAMSRFIAVDVETANSSRASICQVALAAFENSSLVWEWSTLVDPECDFDAGNVRIHGITAEHVRGKPSWGLVVDHLLDSLNGHLLASHTLFDAVAFDTASKRYGLEAPKCSWIDTCQVARHAWPELENHRLKTLCERFGIALNHHEAASDARACGLILCEASAHVGIGTHDWIDRLRQRPKQQAPSQSSRRYSEKITGEGNDAGPLAGSVWVCTGEFLMGERALADMAMALGCDVKDRITKKTAFLVVGTRDASDFKGKQKSRKLLDAEAAIAKGRPIRIMTEREFVDFAQTLGRDTRRNQGNTRGHASFR